MSKKPIKFIAMWDNTGLECLIDVTKHEAELEAYEKKKNVEYTKGSKVD